MCIIIDANVASSLFNCQKPSCGHSIIEWVEKRDGKISIGGKLTSELYNNQNVKSLLREWNRAGIVIISDAEKVDAEEDRLLKAGMVVSDDPHVIALARISGARTLYTDDHALSEDFKKKGLIDNPRGKIYSQPSHTRLLCHTKSCRQ